MSPKESPLKSASICANLRQIRNIQISDSSAGGTRRRRLLVSWLRGRGHADAKRRPAHTNRQRGPGSDHSSTFGRRPHGGLPAADHQDATRASHRRSQTARSRSVQISIEPATTPAVPDRLPNTRQTVARPTQLPPAIARAHHRVGKLTAVQVRRRPQADQEPAVWRASLMSDHKGRRHRPIAFARLMSQSDHRLPGESVAHYRKVRWHWLVPLGSASNLR